MKKLRQPKVLIPLVATAALAWGAFSGQEIGAEEQTAVVEAIQNLFAGVDGLRASVAALLAAVTGWNLAR